MNKRLFQGAAVAALTACMTIGSPAAAQEISSGFYFGAHFGGGGADFDGQFQRPTLFTDPDDIAAHGALAGFHGGYNHLTGMNMGGLGQLMVGLEGGVSFTDFEDSVNAPPALTTAGVRGVVDLLASVRARIGVANDDVLVYLTGGVAFANAHTKAHYGGTVDKDELNSVGGVVGGGVEYALTDMVSLRFEGLYYIFDEKDSINSTPGSSPGLAGDYTRLDGVYVVRAGVSISLDQLMGRVRQ